MADSSTTLNEVKSNIKKFMQEREWSQFHSPKNMSMQIAVEAAELQELFLWCDNEESKKVMERNRQAVEQEVADIAVVLLNFCNQCDIDLSEAIENKMKINAQRYPVEKAKGNAKKYTEL